jgi:hypothetical protein
MEMLKVGGQAHTHARAGLLELQALPAQIAALRAEGVAGRFTADDRYRWVLHRRWIAAGNEALAWTRATGQPSAPTGPGPTCMTCATTWPRPGVCAGQLCTRE